MAKNKLQIQQLNDKMNMFSKLKHVAIPPNGWIKAIRTSLGMSLQQLGNRLGITKQSALDIERREQSGAITLKALREAAHVLDMQLIYGLVPKDGTLEDLIEHRAKELATQIVMRASNTMQLEGQENSPKRLKKAIEERAINIARDMPGILWE